MHLADSMEGGETQDDLRQHGPQPRLVEHRRVAGAYVGQGVDAIDEVHRHQPAPVVLDQLPHPNEVFVVQLGHAAKFVLEQQERLGVRVVQHLERHLALVLSIARGVDGPGPPAPQPPQDAEPVGPDERPAFSFP